MGFLSPLAFGTLRVRFWIKHFDWLIGLIFGLVCKSVFRTLRWWDFDWFTKWLRWQLMRMFILINVLPFSFYFNNKQLFLRSGGLRSTEAPLISTGKFFLPTSFYFSPPILFLAHHLPYPTINFSYKKLVQANISQNFPSTIIPQPVSSDVRCFMSLFFSDWRLPHLLLRCQSLLVWECNLKMVGTLILTHQYIWK